MVNPIVTAMGAEKRHFFFKKALTIQTFVLYFSLKQVFEGYNYARDGK